MLWRMLSFAKQTQSDNKYFNLVVWLLEKCNLYLSPEYKNSEIWNEHTADRYGNKRHIAGIIVEEPTNVLHDCLKIFVKLFSNLHLLSAQLPLCQDEY
jgi:hypothetical protein